MNWYKQAIRIMPRTEALSIFGFPPNSDPSPQEIKAKYKELARRFHEVGNEPDNDKMVQVNNAKDSLESQEPSQSPFESNYGPMSEDPISGGVPEWQTDLRSSYNEVGQDARNLNFAKKSIYDHAKEFGETREISIYAFDGTFLRGSFSVYANDQALGFAGKTMEIWNSHGGNSYATEAVIATEGNNRVQVIRLKGQDVSGKNIFLEHESFNNNPGNDKNFLKELQQLVRNTGLDVTAKTNWYKLANQNPKSKVQKTFYHGTNQDFEEFDKDFDYENAHSYSRDYEVPEGIVFLTSNSDEAGSYGPKVLPVNHSAKRILKIDVGNQAPSRAFDDDYNNIAGYMWSKFQEGDYDALEIIGRDRNGNKKSTLITYPELLQIQQGK